AEPQIRSRILADHVDLILAFDRRAERLQPTVLEGKKSCGSAGDESSVAALAQGEEGDIRKLQSLVHAFEALAVTAKQSAIGPCPDIACAILQDRNHEFVREAILGPEGLEPPCLMMQYAAAISGDPQRAVARHGERANIVVRHSRRVEPRVNHKADPVESSESARRSDPQVAIGRLRDRPDAALGKPILRAPNAA